MSDHVPTEEILKWLPAKTLLRFRCVCKLWKEIIDSPFFVQQHLALQNRKLIIRYEDESELLVLHLLPNTKKNSRRRKNKKNRSFVPIPSVETLSLPSAFLDTLSDQIEKDDPEPFRLVGTLHGIVCLYDNIHNFLIWNPSLRKSSTVSLPALDFDWEDSDVEDRPYFGFWIDPSDKHFKILMFKLVYDDYGEELVDGILYSSIDREWKPVPLDELKDLRPYADSPPVVIDEAAYWKANTEYTDEEGKELLDIVIVAFDFELECFDIIEVPPDAHYNGHFHPTLLNLQDGLALVIWEIGLDCARCDVHVWCEGEWMNVYVFELSFDTVFRVLWVVGKGRSDETCRVLAEADGDLMLYEVKNMDVHFLKSGLKNSAGMYVAYDFVESLLFP